MSVVGNITPYLPVLDLLRHLCGITDADGPETLAAKVHGCLGVPGGTSTTMRPICCSFWGYLRMPNGWPPSAHKRPRPGHLRRYSSCAYSAVDSNHSCWCGGSALDRPTSEEWLASLVESLAPIPASCNDLPAGYRPLWTDKSYATQIALTRLTPEGSREVVQSVPQTTPLSDALRREIVGKAAGNPSFWRS